MRLPLASLLLAPSAVIPVHSHPLHESSPLLTVATTSGTYTGFINTTNTPLVSQWLGIPFAQPPIGALRFMPPLRAPNYGVADAKAYKPICMQDSGNRTGVYWELVPEFQNTDPQSEDCLYLNIWAPVREQKTVGAGAGAGAGVVEKKLLPVIIWVCGGSYKEGGGHAPYQVPDQWIQRTQTHLVVTLNYRLNLFGFPGLPGGAGRNAGLMDVRLVVEWLEENVEGFGGDPKRMVLYGQSAGAGAVLSYQYANPEKPIVGGIIAASSGTAATNPTESPSFHDLAQRFPACANLTSPEELKCMQSIDALELQKAVISSGLGFRPIADGVTSFANMTERLEKGLVAKVPLIAGFTYNEPAAFAPFNISDTVAPESSQNIGNRLACGSVQEADKRLKYGLTTYNYLYSGNFTNITPRYWLGGMHSSELPIVFGTHYLFRGNSTELEWQTSFAMEAFWVSFASNPLADPVDHVGLTWPKYTAAGREMVVFGNASLPSAASIAPASIADYYTGSC